MQVSLPATDKLTTMNKFSLLVFLLAIVPTSLPAVAADSTEEPVTKTLVWPDGTRYVGGVVDGKRSGKGTIFWQDGTRFVGQFENDMRNGPGTMILPDGTVYTGFFKNDELVDTESTIAARNDASTVELEDETVAELGDSTMPMEADSVGDPDEPAEEVIEIPPMEVSQTESEPDSYPTADKVASVSDDYAEDEPAYEQDLAYVEDVPDDYEIEAPHIPGDVAEMTDDVKDELIDTIDLWKNAWSDQNVTQYLANYSDDFVVPGRGQSRRTWEALRRTRLTRPRYINLDISYQRFEFVETNVVDVFFRQTYRSNTYSDLTDKVLRMRKEGNDWKILIERSR